MKTAFLTWHPDKAAVSGSVAATVAMDRAAWEQAGATFTQVDDGDGECPWLAVGEVELDGEPTDFGILDYGEDTTHLIVGGPSEERSNLTAHIVDELLSAAVIPDESLVLEVIGLAQPASVDDKLDYVVDIMEARLAEARSRLEDQIRALNERLDEALCAGIRHEPIADATSDLAPQHLLPPLLIGGVRDLVTLRAVVYTRGHEEPVEVVVPQSFFSVIVGITYSASDVPAAWLAHFDPVSGEALITVEAEHGRVPLIVVGIDQSLSEFDEISFPFMVRALKWLPYSHSKPSAGPLSARSSRGGRLRYRIRRGA
jgi:hypothetical protein